MMTERTRNGPSRRSHGFDRAASRRTCEQPRMVEEYSVVTISTMLTHIIHKGIQ